MPLGLAYQVLKDIVALAKMAEGEPIDPGTSDLDQLKKMGLVEANEDDAAYRWSNPQKLFARTEAPDAAYDVVWVTDRLRRDKKKIVRYRMHGEIDAVLIRKKD